MKGREPSGKANPSIPLTSDPLPRQDVGPLVTRGRRGLQPPREGQPKTSPSRGCSKRLGGASRRTACKVEGTARATTVAVALAVPVDAELEATERGGDGRHRALTCTKQGQLPFEGDSCRRLSICEVFFCCPSEYMVGRKGSVQSESEAWERAETRSHLVPHANHRARSRLTLRLDKPKENCGRCLTIAKHIVNDYHCTHDGRYTPPASLGQAFRTVSGSCLRWW